MTLWWPTRLLQQAGGQDVMATVNGRKITRTEVQKYYDNQVADSPQKPSEEQADTLRLNILRELINNEILMQRAETLGLLATDEEVNAKLAEIKAPYTQEEFDQRLKERQHHRSTTSNATCAAL
jgi:peptidyl-prolyl cis-trans isomerase SurA